MAQNLRPTTHAPAAPRDGVGAARRGWQLPRSPGIIADPDFAPAVLARERELGRPRSSDEQGWVNPLAEGTWCPNGEKQKQQRPDH